MRNPPEWQNVADGAIYVMVARDEWERAKAIPERVRMILTSNQRQDGSVPGAIIRDVLGVLEARW